MRFLHTADLHIGKRVRGFSLIEEQRYALAQVAAIARDEAVDAVLVAGDVFDKGVPPVEALDAFEGFLQELVDADIPAIVIAGNHDSADRLAFGARFMDASHVHIARAFSAEPQYLDLTEVRSARPEGTPAHTSQPEPENAPSPAGKGRDSAAGGAADGARPNCGASDNVQTVRVHLLPFIRPVHVRQAFPGRADEIGGYTDAVRVALDNQPLLEGAANVLVAHQFVIDGDDAPATCDSETVSVGGLDSVQASAFDAFDYVALGHLHGHQRVRRDTVRYSGSLYPYSFSEAGRGKYVTVVDVHGPGDVDVNEVPLAEKRTLREVRGSYEELKAAAPDDLRADDYLHVTLTDDALVNAMDKVRALYPNVMQLDFERAKEHAPDDAARVPSAARTDPLELLASFYQEQAGAELSDEQLEAARAVVNACAEGNGSSNASGKEGRA